MALEPPATIPEVAGDDDMPADFEEEEGDPKCEEGLAEAACDVVGAEEEDVLFISSEENPGSEPCAICFEYMTFVNLPCNCTVKYCGGCWDRALATSVLVNGHARCPSCRSAIAVRYDPKSSSLVFGLKLNGVFCNWRKQIYDRTKNTQIQNLRAYGALVASDSSSEAGGSRESCVHNPMCVCGSELEHLGSYSRVVRLVEDMQPGRSSLIPEPETMREVIQGGHITCDLCDSVVFHGNALEGVWTCKHGPRTMMHPFAYDICQACFAKHSGLQAKHKSGPATISARGVSPGARQLLDGSLLPLRRHLGTGCFALSVFTRSFSGSSRSLEDDSD